MQFAKVFYSKSFCLYGTYNYSFDVVSHVSLTALQIFSVIRWIMYVPYHYNITSNIKQNVSKQWPTVKCRTLEGIPDALFS